MWPRLQRWRGVILVAIAVVATLVLAVGNQLNLYIHPRYILFTVVMVLIAVVLVLASVVSPTAGADDGDEPATTRWGRRFAAIAVLVAGALAIGMLVLPPATLTSATADQRDINSTTIGAQTQDVTAAASAPVAVFATFTVIDWASLLRQTNDVSFYANKPVDVVGFITPDPDDPDNVFYVSRFFVTCCAVDAQPAGIPVYYPNWASEFAADDWVEATGEFAANPSRTSAQALALQPDTITPIEQPSDPYLY